MAKKDANKGKLVVISGPSGVGKSTLCAEVIKKTKAFLSVSITTRPQANGEVDGKDYEYVSKEQFLEQIENDEFLEHAEVFGNFYGTPRSKVEQALAQGKIVILEIDVQGALLVKQQYENVITIFILPPTQSDLVGRMSGRARGEDSEEARKRLDSASTETAAAWQYYDHMVINEELENATQEIVDIIEGKVEKKND